LGQEIQCEVRVDGRMQSGTALLESTEILFRGEHRLKLPFSEITQVSERDGWLLVRTKEHLQEFNLGPRAGKWLDKIIHPKAVLEKLGIKAGDRVALYGQLGPQFEKDLKTHNAVLAKGRISASTAWVFFAAEADKELAAVKAIAGKLSGAMALWIVYPKGQKTITESSVRAAGLKAGLTDIKVVGFSATQTALKFVIPKANR
jgi:hypothetical protein